MLTAIQDSKIKVYKDNCKKQQSISKNGVKRVTNLMLSTHQVIIYNLLMNTVFLSDGSDIATLCAKETRKSSANILLLVLGPKSLIGKVNY